MVSGISGRVRGSEKGSVKLTEVFRKGEIMVKLFVEFSESDAVATLELCAYCLSPEEHSDVKAELLKLGDGAVFKYIDADSIRVELRGEYGVVMDIMSRLESAGWRWGE